MLLNVLPALPEGFMSGLGCGLTTASFGACRHRAKFWIRASYRFSQSSSGNDNATWRQLPRLRHRWSAHL